MCGEVVPALGGQGVPGFELPDALPFVPDVPGVDDPVLGDAPELPGMLPQFPFGVVPGVFGLVPFGFVVAPGVVLPGVVGVVLPGVEVLGAPLGEFVLGVVAPGVVEPGAVCPGAVDPGDDCPACGVAVPAGGVAVVPGELDGLVCGVAGEPAVL